MSSYELSAGAIHIWSIDLESSDASFEGYENLLSPDELTRARRLKFDQDRNRWIVARVSLRKILSRYLDARPEEICFGYGENGKPHLENKGDQIHFNLAHSAALALVGVTSEAPLGIDIEQVRDIPDLDDVIASQFAPTERKSLRSLPTSQRTEAFYNCWTRKEAYIKALGAGLSIPLHGFSVSVEPGLPARVLSIHGDRSKASGWSLYHLQPKPDYIGALAIRCAERFEISQFVL